MFNAFTNRPNFAPYNFLRNRIPLTYGLTPSRTTRAACLLFSSLVR